MSKPTATASIELVTVQQAEAWLSCNPKNRPINTPHTKRMASDMEAREFMFNGESVKIATSGDLLDGQHRLTPIVLSQKPQWLLVVRGLDPVTVATMDIGAKRQVSHWLGMLDYKYGTDLSPALKLTTHFSTGDIQNMAAQGEFHPLDATAVLASHPGVLDSLKALAPNRTKLRRQLSFGTLVFFHYIFSHADPAKADAFMDSLATGAGLAPDSPILMFRESMAANRTNKGSKLTTIAKMAMLIKSWNSFYNDKPMRLLRYKASEVFPKVAGITYKGNVPQL